MNTRRMLSMLIVAIAISVSTGCSMPDYQLEINVTSVSYGAPYATVNYTLENIGNKDIDNAVVRFGIRDTPGGTTLGSEWTSSTDVSVGQTTYGSVNVWCSSTPGFPFEAYVISVGWDTDGNNSIF
jgi:hypothetical protein